MQRFRRVAQNEESSLSPASRGIGIRGRSGIGTDPMEAENRSKSTAKQAVQSPGPGRDLAMTDDDLEVLSAMAIEAASKLRRVLGLSSEEVSLPSPSAPGSHEAARKVAEQITK